MEVDEAGVEHRRLETQRHAARIVMHRHRRRRAADRARLHGRDRDLRAGKELRPLAGLRNEVGLGQGLDQTLVLQRRNQGVDPEAVGVDHLREQRAERLGRRRGAGKEPAEKGDQGDR